jgi:pyruvate kinase
MFVDSMSQTEKLIEQGIEYAKQNNLVRSGDYVITTAGVLEGVSGSTNLMRVTVVP